MNENGNAYENSNKEKKEYAPPVDEIDQAKRMCDELIEDMRRIKGRNRREM